MVSRQKRCREKLPGKFANLAATNRTQMRKAMAMIVVIFESWPTNAQKYIDMGEALRAHLKTLDGFISIERFRSVSDPAKLVALSFWRDEAAVEAWRNNEVHRLIQERSRQDVFRDYRLRVAAVLRDYGMFERDQAPQECR
jgi:heme-degrading monooxygenase HmoA